MTEAACDVTGSDLIKPGSGEFRPLQNQRPISPSRPAPRDKQATVPKDLPPPKIGVPAEIQAFGYVPVESPVPSEASRAQSVLPTLSIGVPVF